DVSISCAAPDGRLTLRPVFFSISACCCSSLTLRFSRRASTCTASALTMKMMSMTRKTSVNGVMLISAKIASPPSSPPASSSGSFPIAIAIAFRALGHLAGLLVIDRLAAIALVIAASLAARLALARLLEQELEELVGQELHLGRDAVGALAEEV